MPIVWFRFYNNVIDNPKIQLLPIDMRWRWIELLCLAAENNGVIPSLRNAAYRLRVTEAEMQKILDFLEESGLVDRGEELRPHDWDKWQYRDKTNALRQQRFREKKKAQSVTITENNDKITDSNTLRNDQIQIQITDTDNNTLVQKRAAKPPKGGAEINSDFEEFWQLYPRREARKEAEKAYAKARRLVPKEELHGKTAAYARSRANQDPQFTPLAASWLNKERWRDVSTNPTQAASAPRHYGPHVPPAPEDRIDEAAILAARIYPKDPSEWPTEEETREEFERFMALWPKERASGSKDHDMWRAVRSRWAADDLFAELELYRATLTPLMIRTAPWMWRWLEKYFLILPNERLTRKTKQNSNGNVIQLEGRMS